MKKYDAIVIGAGIGGLSAAALWSKRGKKILLTESHYATGGCASYFKRREGFYDVGATTLSGLRDNRPTARLIRDLNLNLSLKKCNPGIVVHIDGDIFCLYSERDKLCQEIFRVFNYKFESTLKSWQNLENHLWKALEVIRPLNMLSFKNLSQFLHSEARGLIFHPNLFLKSFYGYLPKELQRNEKFVRCIDQILMISTQQTSRTCPAFMGILGFLYPMDTYAIEGGMHSLCEELESKIKAQGGEIILRNPCLKIEKKGNEFLVQTKKESFLANEIISNISPELFNKIYKNSFQLKQDKGDIWGAMTAYFAFKSKRPVKDYYHQINDLNRSLFYSFSVHHEEYQCVTVSTHIKKERFKERDEDYQSLKDSFQREVLEVFETEFSTYGIEEIKFDSVGTPLSFEYYTSRPKGEVGGLIHKNPWSLTRLISNQLKSEGIYYTGDYSFPGQGIVSVIQSAYNTLD